MGIGRETRTGNGKEREVGEVREGKKEPKGPKDREKK